MECRTTAVHDGGDHSIVVGEVLGVSEPGPAGGPLLYYASRYRTPRRLTESRRCELHRLLELVQRPVEVFLADDQGRGEADRGPVGVLGQHPARGQALARLPAGAAANSTPAHRPRPRTSRTASRGSAASRSCRCVPSLADRSWNSPVASIAMTSRPTAQASGLPPNVEPCWPGRTRRGPRGRTPPPTPARCRRRAPCPGGTCPAPRSRARRRTWSPCGPARTGSRRRSSARRAPVHELPDRGQVARAAARSPRPRPGSARSARRPPARPWPRRARPGRRRARRGSRGCTGRRRRGRRGRWRS